MTQVSNASSPVLKTEPCEDPLALPDEFTNLEVGGTKADARSLLYAGHEIKEEMVIGSTEISQLVTEYQHRQQAHGARPSVANEHDRSLHSKSTRQKQGPSSSTTQPKPSSNPSGNDHYQCTNSFCAVSAVKKPFACGQCNMSFALKGTLIRHLAVHTGIKPFTCEECNKSFSRKGNLRKHVKDIHAKPFACDHCGMRFGRKEVLRKHLSTHNQKNPEHIKPFGSTHNQKNPEHIKLFSCDQCDKGFSTNSNLTKHLINIHAGEKQFSCTQCDTRFSIKSSLSEHMSVHSVVKPFTCDQCSTGFAKNKYLQRHMKTHSGESYPCRYCDQVFDRMHRLAYHLRLHVKLFSCDQCKMRFDRNVDMKKHLCTPTGEK